METVRKDAKARRPGGRVQTGAVTVVIGPTVGISGAPGHAWAVLGFSRLLSANSGETLRSLVLEVLTASGAGRLNRVSRWSGATVGVCGVRALPPASPSDSSALVVLRGPTAMC